MAGKNLSIRDPEDAEVPFPIRTIYFENPTVFPEINSFTYETASTYVILYLCLCTNTHLLSCAFAFEAIHVPYVSLNFRSKKNVICMHWTLGLLSFNPVIID